LPVAVDMHEKVRLECQAGPVRRKSRGPVAAVLRLRLDPHIIDASESGDRGIRRSVVGDDERDSVREWRDVVADLVDEPSDALRLVVGGHHDGEMSNGHADPHSTTRAGWSHSPGI